MATSRPGVPSQGPLHFTARDPKAGWRAAVSVLGGVVVAFATARAGYVSLSALAGWDGAIVIFLAWTWSQIGRVDARQTAAMALREDPSKPVTDVLLLLAAVASLVGVGQVIMLGGSRNDPVGPGMAVGVATGSVVHLKTPQIRATALRHGLLSFVFGTVIIATTINLVAGLAK